MHRFVALALAALGGSPLSVLAQDAPGTNYALCTVTDTGRAPAQVWASPVFEFNAPVFDVEALNRVAGEFLRHVSGLGGAGNKDCVALETRAEAEALRQEQRSIWDKKMFFVKAGHWRDVAWTPPPLAAAPMAATVPRWFRCYATQTDVPGRYATAITVSSGVFQQSVPGERAYVAAAEQAQAYREEFGQIAQANNIPEELSMCANYDTQGEADKAERDYRKMIGGFNAKYDVVAWAPSGKAIVPANGAATPAAESASIPAPPPVASAAAPEPAAVATVPQSLYCVAFLEGVARLRAPVHELHETGPAALAASLNNWAMAAQAAHPGKWGENLDKISCHQGDSRFAGETLCFGADRIKGKAQMAGLFCNASRTVIDARVEDMNRSDGGASQSFDWPPRT